MAFDCKRIGNIGEAETLAAFVRKGIPTYIPFGDAEAADLIADFGGKLQRIQVKASSRISKEGYSVQFYCAQIHHDRTKERKHWTSGYSISEVDWFSLVDFVNGEIYLIQNTGGLTTVNITFGNPKRPSANTRWAKDCLFDTVIDRIEKNGE